MRAMGDNVCIGGIEAGGTTFKCTVAALNLEKIDQAEFPTRSPEATLADIASFFSRYPDLNHIGIASFGPLDLRSGTITDTPKLEWQNYPLLNAIQDATSTSASIETDVTAAGLAEYMHAADDQSLVYITVGTGIGAAYIPSGQPLSNTGHAEMGHIRVPRAPNDRFTGICPFHRDCLEGLASGPAMEARWGIAPDHLDPDHNAWVMEAHYLAHLCENLIRILMPDKILFGGGVMQNSALLEQIKVKTHELMGGYQDTHTEITKAALEPDSGLIGALVVASRAFSV